ncbi:hypothetical protein ADLECEL_05210 [Adlercreutzia equolifaciens subsp. celatus]|nr:hypothetical protein ADLECEL_05210 [Adlercreutzia equolifaciens subsp. celatus]
MAPALRDRLTADGLDEDARCNLAALIEAQRACTGAVPTDRRLVVETCPDETGDMRVILHSPLRSPRARALGAGRGPSRYHCAGLRPAGGGL